jgi:hypothetical protein
LIIDKIVVLITCKDNHEVHFVILPFPKEIYLSDTTYWKECGRGGREVWVKSSMITPCCPVFWRFSKRK